MFKYSLVGLSTSIKILLEVACLEKSERIYATGFHYNSTCAVIQQCWSTLRKTIDNILKSLLESEHLRQNAALGKVFHCYIITKRRLERASGVSESLVYSSWHPLPVLFYLPTVYLNLLYPSTLYFSNTWM